MKDLSTSVEDSAWHGERLLRTSRTSGDAATPYLLAYLLAATSEDCGWPAVGLGIVHEGSQVNRTYIVMSSSAPCMPGARPACKHRHTRSSSFPLAGTRGLGLAPIQHRVQPAVNK